MKHKFIIGIIVGLALVMGIGAMTNTVDNGNNGYWWGGHPVKDTGTLFLQEVETIIEGSGLGATGLALTDDKAITFGTGLDATLEWDTAATPDQLKLDATTTTAGYAILLETTDGGIELNADGATNGDIALRADSEVVIKSRKSSIQTDGAFYPTSVVLEVHDANDTLDAAADVGTLHLVDTDAVVITLPAVGTGQKYKIMNIGLDYMVEIHVDVNGSDKILGGCGFTALDDGDRITNTKATADIGDYVVLEYGTADGWFITEMVGTWADGG